MGIIISGGNVKRMHLTREQVDRREKPQKLKGRRKNKKTYTLFEIH